jgi:hypothetical protein
MLVVHDDDGWLDASERRAAIERGLEGRPAFEQRKELLRERLARHRPQSGAAAAGEDHGLEFHRSPGQ